MGNLTKAFTTALKTVDPDKIRRRFPDKKLESEYDEARAILGEVLSEVDATQPIRLSTLEKLKRCEKQFLEFSNKVHPKTELGGRSELNKIYGWVDAGYVERTIFLAGLAQGKDIREPYKTQIKLLPCNACLFRYRQIYNIWESVKEAKDTSIPDEVLVKLSTMQDSYLNQMEHFSESIRGKGNDHPFAAYTKMLSKLLLAEHYQRQNKMKQANEYEEQAQRFSMHIPTPEKGMHYMYKQYHGMNYEEFFDFERLSKKHKNISMLLKRNNSLANNISDEDLAYPSKSYDIIPYVVMGGRAASFVMLGSALAVATSMDFPVLQQLVTDIWSQAAVNIPGMSESDITMLAFHGGGPAGIHGGGPAA